MDVSRNVSQKFCKWLYAALEYPIEHNLDFPYSKQLSETILYLRTMLFACLSHFDLDFDSVIIIVSSSKIDRLVLLTNKVIF